MRRRGVFVGLLLAVLAGPEWLGVSMRAANDQQAQPQRTQPPSTDGKLNIIAFGAHPDDCDQGAGGVAAKYAALGHRVRFVSVTNVSHTRIGTIWQRGQTPVPPAASLVSCPASWARPVPWLEALE